MSLRAEIRSATSSMTSVPKPLKMLREHFDQLKQTFDAMVRIMVNYGYIIVIIMVIIHYG